VSGVFNLKEDDIMEVAVGQQHQDALFDPYSKATIHPVKNNEVHSGCGGTFVSHIVCKEDVSKKSDRSAVRKLLIVAGGAGYGPDVEYSHASLTQYAKGNRNKRSGGIAIRSHTATAGAGYENHIHAVLGNSSYDANPKSYETGLRGGYGYYLSGSHTLTPRQFLGKYLPRLVFDTFGSKKI